MMCVKQQRNSQIKYYKDICINTVIGEAIVDYESPDEEYETTEAEQNESAVSEPEQNEIPQEVIEICAEIIMSAVNALYKTAGELGRLFSAFAESCMIIQNARPPP